MSRIVNELYKKGGKSINLPPAWSCEDGKIIYILSNWDGLFDRQ